MQVLQVGGVEDLPAVAHLKQTLKFPTKRCLKKDMVDNSLFGFGLKTLKEMTSDRTNAENRRWQWAPGHCWTPSWSIWQPPVLHRHPAVHVYGLCKETLSWCGRRRQGSWVLWLLPAFCHFCIHAGSYLARCECDGEDTGCSSRTRCSACVLWFPCCVEQNWQGAIGNMSANKKSVPVKKIKCSILCGEKYLQDPCHSSFKVIVCIFEAIAVADGEVESVSWFQHAICGRKMVPAWQI